MTPGQLQLAAPYLAAGLLALALVFFLISLRYFRKSRTDFYWRRRRTAGQRGWRLFVWSLGLMLVSGLICLATGVAGMLNPRPTPTVGPTRVVVASSPTATATPSPTIQQTATPLATSAATITPVVYPTTQEATVQATQAATETATGTTTGTTTGTVTETTTQLATETATPTTSPTTQPPTQTATPTANETTATETETATLELSSASPQATVTQGSPTGSPTVMPTATPTATQTSTATPTNTPQQTATPQPSLTSSPTATETLVRAPLTNTVLDSSVTPGPNAKLTITALDSHISADFKPVAPATTFSAGFNRIYYFITFAGMQSGVLWRRQLLKDGNVLEDSAYLWGMAQDGDAYFFFGQENGFQPGSYQIRLFIGQTDQPITVASFTVK